MYDSDSAIKLLQHRFPQLAAELDDEQGLLHLQIAVFSDFAQGVIDEGDAANWRRVNDAFNELWRNCSPDVTNALNVSFLEHLSFTDGRKRRSWAFNEMPPIMRNAWEQMEEYNKGLHDG